MLSSLAKEHQQQQQIRKQELGDNYFHFSGFLKKFHKNLYFLKKKSECMQSNQPINSLSLFLIHLTKSNFSSNLKIIISLTYAILWFAWLYLRVSEAFVNQRKIDTKVKQLNQNTSQFVKQTQQWINLLENFNTALKVSVVKKICLSQSDC